MDHAFREIKETLFTRHNQTVLQLLANTKEDSLQAIYTSIVNTAIDNMTDNRVLNNQPPHINDEETYLMRRQRATLSQLLNSYKVRLEQTDSSSYPECGMDLQGVPHPTALTPDNYGKDLSRQYEH